MLFNSFLATAIFVASVSTFPIVRRVDESLVPEFGIQAGVNPTGTGDCDGVTNDAGQVVKVPCTCPPDRALFIQDLNANVAAGRAINNTNPDITVNFPAGNTKEDKLARLNAATVTLQNLFGSGKGCPQAATTFGAQLKAIQAGTDTTAASAAPAAPAPAAPAPATPPAADDATEAPTANNGAAAGGVDESLVPEFGIEAGVNPTGTGDCDGVKNDAGQAVKIPCTCPPDRALFIQDLNTNVAAGRAVNNTNPDIKVTFPSGNTKEDKLTRLNAATVTLQNLFGSGKGCPQAATTFGAQAKAIQAGTA